jgi:hypothetical protein
MSRGCSLARSRHRAPEIKKGNKIPTKKDEEFLELAKKAAIPGRRGFESHHPHSYKIEFVTKILVYYMLLSFFNIIIYCDSQFIIDDKNSKNSFYALF